MQISKSILTQDVMATIREIDEQMAIQKARAIPNTEILARLVNAKATSLGTLAMLREK